MSRPVIIACAITGSRPRKSDNPAVPITPEEQIESTQAAFEEGATLVHVHVRDENENPSFDPERFGRVLEGVRKYCPGMIVELSTGGIDGAPSERAGMLPLHPDMAAIAPGSVDFGTGVLLNPPAVIESLSQETRDRGIKPTMEIFDLSMLYTTWRLVGQGLLVEPVHFHFVLGGLGSLPARRQVLDFLVAEMHDLFPQATWMASGLGQHQEVVMDWALSLGGHIRTGLEDNIRLTRDELAPSNAVLVRRAALRCVDYGTHAATTEEARRILGLAPSGVTAEPA